MRFEVASVDSLIIYFGDKIGEDVASSVRGAFFTLKKLDMFVELIPSYTSLLIKYDFIKYSFDEIKELILKELENSSQEIIESRNITLPVYYGIEVGLDLEDMSKQKGLSIEEIIQIHTKKEYFVYAIGFAPGFPYMGEVDKLIATPRLANPRAKVPKGSVGIADTQTAVYPRVSPGGWNIIGRTPIEMFDKSYDGFSYFKVGDKVTFKSIDKEEFLSLGGEL
ncbi:5-oxoprolinase subunit PxpB [Sulfurospirillum sp. 1307]|jgi:KipI family sensor histidine kinase inhibitor